MKTTFLLIVLILSIPLIKMNAQDIAVIRGDSVVYGEPGDLELVLYAEVVNISSSNQTVFLIRTENNLPQNWTSSLCFDVTCYPPDVDTAYTTELFPPNDTVEASVHFYPDMTTPGTAHVQIQIGTLHNPGQVTTLNLTASTEPVAVAREELKLNDFRLYQNYPNPFNPTTKISYVIPQRSNVNVKVYDIMGKEVATLVNEIEEPGAHSLNFNAENLSSGIYFYKITAGEFSSVKKMILIK
jgi:hypothetical protein